MQPNLRCISGPALTFSVVTTLFNISATGTQIRSSMSSSQLQRPLRVLDPMLTCKKRRSVGDIPHDSSHSPSSQTKSFSHSPQSNATFSGFSISANGNPTSSPPKDLSLNEWECYHSQHLA